MIALFHISFFNPNLKAFFTENTVHLLVKAGIIVLISLPILLLLRRWAISFFTKKYTSHYGLLAGKLIFYTGLIIMVISVMNQLGISLAPLLGAAGIVGVALGFASQTSVSNIISGLFLIAEQPFKVDDIIKVNETTGVVMSVDAFSVKIRTFDNQFVRIPNEMIFKTQVTNVTRFPIRRLNAKISVAYKEDISHVREILMDIAEKNEYSLSEPKPLIVFDSFNSSSIDLLFLVWVPVKEFILLKNTIQEEIKARFDEEDIEIPFPHISLYAGSQSKAIPIEIMDKRTDAGTKKSME
ncbi:MAG TPA: mechanosensitive ion channel family protein [Balneolaceae bacterium]|nr:mechanosensitive ion channel family protein [Balneolaceae bacterium]